MPRETKSYLLRVQETALLRGLLLITVNLMILAAKRLERGARCWRLTTRRV
jgi:hypothetical protein